MEGPKDKLMLDLSDDPALEEHFSRKASGDKCTFKVTATLDEIANKVAVLSVDSVEVQAYEDSKPEGETEETEESTEPVAQWAAGEA